MFLAAVAWPGVIAGMAGNEKGAGAGGGWWEESLRRPRGAALWNPFPLFKEQPKRPPLGHPRLLTCPGEEARLNHPGLSRGRDHGPADASCLAAGAGGGSPLGKEQWFWFWFSQNLGLTRTNPKNSNKWWQRPAKRCMGESSAKMVCTCFHLRAGAGERRIVVSPCLSPVQAKIDS